MDSFETMIDIVDGNKPVEGARQAGILMLKMLCSAAAAAAAQ